MEWKTNSGHDIFSFHLIFLLTSSKFKFREKEKHRHLEKTTSKLLNCWMGLKSLCVENG
jgi:hypothetical protein